MADVTERGATTRIFRFRDAGGHLQEIRVTSSQAAAIDNVMRQSRRESSRWKKRHRSFTDMKIRDGQVEDAQSPKQDLGNAWEGPRFRFTLLIGESRTWDGDPMFELEGQTYCSFCLGSKLPSHAYCLGCDASGMDRRIPRGEAEARKGVERPGLKGGLEGKR